MQVKIKSFKKVVTSNAAPQMVAANQIITNSCKIKALSTNVGSVFIGDATTQEFELAKGEEVSITEIFEKDGGSADIDIQQLFCRVATNNDGICVIYADRTSRF